MTITTAMLYGYATLTYLNAWCVGFGNIFVVVLYAYTKKSSIIADDMAFIMSSMVIWKKWVFNHCSVNPRASGRYCRDNLQYKTQRLPKHYLILNDLFENDTDLFYLYWTRDPLVCKAWKPLSCSIKVKFCHQNKFLVCV